MNKYKTKIDLPYNTHASLRPPSRNLIPMALSEKGSTTLEGAIIIPIVIFVVCLSVYIILLLFGQAQMQSSSGYAAQRVSPRWRGVLQNNSASQNGEGVESPEGKWTLLYDRIFDTNVTGKLDAASGLAEARLDGVVMQGYVSAGASTEFRNGMFGKNLAVALQGGITMPNKRVTAAFGYGNHFGAAYGARSIVPDFAENIRNVRYVREIELKIKEAPTQYVTKAKSFSDVIGHIRKYVGSIQ